MDRLRLTIALIILFSIMTFVGFFGRLPILRRTPIAFLYNLIWVYIPSFAAAVDKRVTAGRITNRVRRFHHFMVHDRHPTVVILFLAIMIGAEGLFLPPAWPELSTFLRFTSTIVIALPYIFLYLSCAADPGYITSVTHAWHMSLYPYDHTLFHPGQYCRTCKHLKPPRSKHCSICKRCVAKTDHHCIFINSCVGYGNHHWFLLLLFSTSLLTVYGAALGLHLLADWINGLAGWTLWPFNGMRYRQWLLIFGFSVSENIGIGSVTLLALLTSPLVLGLSIYTMYLVYCGTTTNETLKWSCLKEDMKDGFAFKRTLTADRARDTRIEPRCARWPVHPNQIVVCRESKQPPPPESNFQGQGEWELVRNLNMVENLYDLGFKDNLFDSFVPNYAFGSSPR